MSAHDQLLVVIDPVARRSDGESVRIAKDVLCAGAEVKVCWPDGPEEFGRMLSRRGSRRPVVIGDDRALLRAVTQLHRFRELADGALSLIPVGARGAVQLAGALGVPGDAVAAARAVLDGAERRLDLLVDDSDGVVLGGLRIPVGRAPVTAAAPGTVWDTCRTLVRTLVRPAPSAPAPRARTQRLRVEADGRLLSDLDAPVEDVTVCSRGGAAEVVVRPRSAEPVRATASAVTVSGASFRYRADALVTGPVWTRTWTVRPGSWSLTVPVAVPGPGAESAGAAAG
ncbi:diacylglycerol kinase [Streptomyces sp. LP05-1]|uniref:Diacylglycerol kinase n=1 Tax=Streptomyces pyxinae TaxID=2970734 RepID=A0ABT2CML7_9ACTN|nr:diacylglycerol kinase [Streptomyces sp. LP05-1]MCS0638683.1 diacylglycerol kinase [Streptomyces sp. LP05-1]